MRKIDHAWKGLYEGYLSVRKAQRQLELEWIRAIKVAEKRKYQRQHRDWLAKLASQRNRYRVMVILCPILLLLLLACAAFSLLLPFILLAWGTAVFISIMLIGILLVQRAVINDLEKHPPVKPTDGQKLLEITDRWWNQLKPPPIEIKKDGDEGEKALLDVLENRLSNQHIALHQYMVRQNLDADVLVLGPNGIWLLESKFNSGKIICQNGEWSQIKSYFGPGGEPESDYKTKNPYDKQWLREKNSITQTILHRLPQDMHWVINEIKGGIVFTHNNVILDIDQSCQVEYGRISYWVKKISNGSIRPNLTTEILLCITDAILEYANEISSESSHKSAKQLAMDIFNNAETDIPVFIKANL